MKTHSSILAWRIPWTGEPGRLQSIGSYRVGQDWSNLVCMHELVVEFDSSSHFQEREARNRNPFGIFREQFPPTAGHREKLGFPNQFSTARKNLGPPTNRWAPVTTHLGLPRWLSAKEPACRCRRCKRCGVDPWVGKAPWRRAWQPTSVSCLGSPMGRGAWEATVHEVTMSWTRLRRLSTQAHTSHWTLVGLGGPKSSFRSQLIPVCPSSLPQLSVTAVPGQSTPLLIPRRSGALSSVSNSITTTWNGHKI